MLKDDPVIAAAIASGQWNMNDGGDNGVCISNAVHSGSHPNYTRSIRTQLRAIGTWPAAASKLRTIISTERAKLKRRTTKLD